MRALGCTLSAEQFRITVYQNLRRSTITKLDNCKKSGASADAKFTEADHLMLQFLDKESPAVKGLAVRESNVPKNAQSVQSIAENMVVAVG